MERSLAEAFNEKREKGLCNVKYVRNSGKSESGVVDKRRKVDWYWGK